MIELARSDVLYPRPLLDLRNPPDPIWVEGDVSTLLLPAISIVGTRRMTPYGERVARELAFAIATAGIVVVSGLAQGIDSVAHRAALDAGGNSIAVLGSGLLAAESFGLRKRLATRLRKHGCLISEYSPLASAAPWTFVRRNATIAALGRCTVIVEAPVGSGALITAREARLLGRTVYAVPGPLGALASVGTNELIASGEAITLLGPASLGLDQLPLGLSQKTDAIIDQLAAGPLTPDALDAAPARIAELLLSGRIVALPDGRISRV